MFAEKAKQNLEFNCFKANAGRPSRSITCERCAHVTCCELFILLATNSHCQWVDAGELHNQRAQRTEQEKKTMPAHFWLHVAPVGSWLWQISNGFHAVDGWSDVKGLPWLMSLKGKWVRLFAMGKLLTQCWSREWEVLGPVESVSFECFSLATKTWSWIHSNQWHNFSPFP